MLEDDFYATIKLTTGEEVLAQVTPASENRKDFFILNDPIVLESSESSIDHAMGVTHNNLVPKKWLNYSTDDMAIVHSDKVVTISELDMFGIEFYRNALLVAKVSSPIKRKVKTQEHSGFIGTVEDARAMFERLYKGTV